MSGQVNEWFLFPLEGLKFTHPVNLESELFPNIVFINKDELNKLFESLPQQYHEGGTFDRIRARETYDVYLAIRYAINDGNYDKAEQTAEIASGILTLLFFSSSGYVTCGLAHKIQHTNYEALSYRTDNHMGFSLEKREAVRFAHKSNVQPIALTDLKNKIDQSRAIGPIANIVFPATRTNSLISAPFVSQLRMATISLANAMYASWPGDSIARCVTTIEILLKPFPSKDKTVKKRLNNLIHNFEAIVDEMYSSRHKWVHEGILTAKSSFARKCIELVLLAMTNYCEILNSHSNLDTRELMARLEEGPFELS